MMIVTKLLKKIRNNWILLVLIILALLARFYFLDKFISVSGDLLLYADWGKMYWEYGGKNYYYVKDWYYAPPNYPPLINLYYAYAYKAFDYKYLFAELHNLIRVPPSVFIIYYYKYGYFINLKLFSIICDVLIGILIYKATSRLFKNKNTSLLAGSLYLFNPAAIILSSVWGQTDSVIALLSVLAFVLLLKKRFVLSSILFTIGLLFKPNWIIFIPIYILIYFINRPKIKSLVFSAIVLSVVLILASIPFSDNPISFYSWLFKDRILSTINASPHASISAFNFYTTFLQIDYHLSSFKVLGLPVKIIGQMIFLYIFLFCLKYVLSKKADAESIFKAVAVIGLGSFLFLPGMLERYFFPAIIPFAILAVKNKKLLLLYFTFTITLGLNVIWALFRRSNGNINDIFTDHNFLLIKIISICNVLGFIVMYKTLFADNLLKLSLWKKQVNI